MRRLLPFLIVLFLPLPQAAAAATEQLLPRTMPPLCRIERSAGKDKLQLVWTANTPTCVRPDKPVLLKAPMPDMELLLMLNQSKDIVARSRLLMAGSTPCAPIRAMAFQLSSIDIGIDKLNVLEFDSGGHGTVQVAVRKYKHELLPWRVSCAPRR
jgi:hypothetical protein